MQRLREQGIEDVYLEPEDAPPEFWAALVLATTWNLVGWDSVLWEDWTLEARYSGLPLLGKNDFAAFVQVVRVGAEEDSPRLGSPNPESVGVATRLAAIEHLLDICEDRDLTKFTAAVNDRAGYFRVGVRLEGRRFVPATSEHSHTEIVQPTLLLLSDGRFADVDGLYRKAFDRVLSGDASGAITAATSAVEEMLRLLLPSMKGQTLGPLAKKARADGIIPPSVEGFITTLYGVRPESDAHAGGTSDHDLAMLALHLTASILLYLGRTDAARDLK